MSVLTTGVVFGLLLYPWVLLARKDVVSAVVVVVALVAFSSHVFAIMYRLGLAAEIVRGLIPVKDLLALTTFAVLLWTSRRSIRRRQAIAALAVALIVAAYAVVGLVDGSSDVLAIATRALLVAPLGLCTGLLMDPDQRYRLLSRSSFVLAIAAAYSILELAAPVEVVAHWIAVGNYWDFVKEQPGFTVSIDGVGLVPGNFFVDPYDPESLRRLSGSFGDPLTAGSGLAFGLLASLTATSGRRRMWQMGVIAVALLLTFTRAGWLLAVGGLLPMAISWLARLDVRRRLGLGALAVLAACLTWAVLPPLRQYVADVMSGRHSSTLGHINGLERISDYQYSLPGSGIGSIGALEGQATESVFVTILVQLGMVAGAVYLLATIYLILCARDRWTPRSSFWCLFAALMVTWAVSEQWLTFNAGWLIGLFLAAGTPQPAAHDDSHDVPPSVVSRTRAAR